MRSVGLLLRNMTGRRLQNIVSRRTSRFPVFRDVETINPCGRVSIGENVVAGGTLQALH
jgi:hypothetical protein